MRLYLLYAILSLFYFGNLSAQKGQVSHGPAGAHKSPVIKGIYQFPSFTDGTVVLRNGIMYEAPLNYNVLGDEIQFINEKGDTLTIADPLTINFISLQNTKFYYEKGQYLQAISTEKDNPGVTLTSNRQFFRRLKEDANYNVPDTVAGQYFTPDGRRYRLESDVALHTMLTVQQQYFFIDKYAHFTIATQRFILQHYYKHEQDIRAFIKSGKINFEKSEDLIKLLRFCSKFDS